jgi:hypothetical protein
MRKAFYGIVNLRCGAGEKQRNNFNLSPPQQLFADYSTNLAKEPVNEPAIFTGRERNRHPYLLRLRRYGMFGSVAFLGVSTSYSPQQPRA